MTKDQALAEPLIKEVMLDAPVARVWKALTDKEELKQWCFEMKEFEPRVGFEFQFYGEKEGEKFLHLCKVLEAEPQKSMKWLWSYENIPGQTYVRFELTPLGAQTKLRLTHEGLERLPQDNNYAKNNFVEGWDMILGQLLPGFLSKHE